jgi:hypothetical protein
MSAGHHRDVRELARRRLPREVFDFVDGGAENELTRAANETAFGRSPSVFASSSTWPTVRRP